VFSITQDAPKKTLESYKKNTTDWKEGKKKKRK